MWLEHDFPFQFQRSPEQENGRGEVMRGEEEMGGKLVLGYLSPWYSRNVKRGRRKIVEVKTRWREVMRWS